MIQQFLGNYPDLLIEQTIKRISEKKTITVHMGFDKKLEWNKVLSLNYVLAQTYNKRNISSGHHASMKEFEIPVITDLSNFSLETSLVEDFSPEKRLYLFKNEESFIHNPELRKQIRDENLEVKDVFFKFSLLSYDEKESEKFFSSLMPEEVFRHLFFAATQLMKMELPSLDSSIKRFKDIGLSDWDASQARFNDFGYKSLEKYYFLMKHFFKPLSDSDLFTMVDNYKVLDSIYLKEENVYSLTQSQIKQIETYL